MAAKKFSHHFVPHHHPETDEQHRAHALNSGALFGYLIIFLVTVVGFYFIRTTAPQILGTAQYTAEQIVELTNIKRAENGLPSLALNSILAAAARAKIADMFANNYWAHYSPQGKSPWSFISAFGYRYIYAGENLARDFNDAESVVDAWMVSPTHKSNLLDKNFKEIGVAVAGGKLTGRDGVLVVQMFGSSVTSATNQQIVQQIQGQAKEGNTPSDAAQKLGNLNVEAQSEPATTSIDSGSATVLASRQFSISKIISIILVGFVFLLFVVEVAFATKKSHIELKSSTLAHLGLLALVLFAVWYAVQGTVI